jgi:hypothetical protein
VCLPQRDSGHSTASLFGRSFSRERAVDAPLVAVASESGELALKIQSVSRTRGGPDTHAGWVDQPFDEWVRAGLEGYGLDLLYFEYPKVPSPAMESERRIMFRTQMLRQRLSRLSLIEHATCRHAIDVSRLDANADAPARNRSMTTMTQ